MALTFVLGNAGSGKTTYLRNFILDEAKKNPEKKYLVLVPEQFTMSTQKAFVEASDKKCIMNVDVLSFERLAYRVFEELGMSDVTVLEDVGKMLVLRQVVQQNRAQLTTLKYKVEKPGYLDQVKSLLTEFAQYNITPSDLEEMLGNMPKNMLFYKLQDLQILYKGMEDYLRGHYITAEKLLVVLAQVAHRSTMLKDAVVCFDGYTGFTPVQNLFMKQLLPLASEVYITVLTDVKDDVDNIQGNHELFYISKKFIRQMKNVAQENQVPVRPYILMPDSALCRFEKAPGLAALEKNIFRSKKEIYDMEQDNVEIVRLLNPKKELHYVAGRIRDYIQAGYQYQDIAVVSADLATYGRYVKTIFEQARIPYFMDEKNPIIYSGFVEFMKGALTIVEEDFSQEGVFRYLKSKMTDLTDLEIEELENYVMALRIRGHKLYGQPFVRKNRTYREAELERLEQIRLKMMQPLEIFYAKMTKASGVADYATALYELMEYYHIEEQLMEDKDYLFSRGDIKKSKEYEQSFGLMVGLLDKCVSLLGKETMTPGEFLEILSAGMEQAKIGSIPIGRDRVIFGDMERSRLENIKILFFVGVNDGVIPRITSGSMCLSQKEREVLESMQVELAATPKERSFIQQFYLYMAMTKPESKLILTYAESTPEGTETKPAYIIGQLKHLFTKLKEETGEAREFLGPKLSFRRVVDALRDKESEDVVAKLLYQWYKNQPEWEARIENLVALAQRVYQEEKLSAEVALALYGEELFGSVSRFEDYSKCAMKHFLDYGLGLKEREEGEFQATELGSIVHKALELYGKYVLEDGLLVTEVPTQKREEYVQRAVLEAVGEQMDSALFENARSEYQIERITRLVQRSVWGLTGQFEKSEYVPRFYEQTFTEKLHPDSVVRLRGVVDRIDVAEGEEPSYRVVDYKTGSNQVDLAQIYGGLQLQLMIYLDAARKVMKKHYPQKDYEADGAYYYLVQDPMIELKDYSDIEDEKLDELLLKELQMTGFGQNAKEDAGVKNKTLRPSASELQQVVSYVKDKMEEIGQEILDGHIEAKPYLYKKESGCDYCNYRGICGFDEKLSGYTYREVENLSDEEAMAKMKCQNS